MLKFWLIVLCASLLGACAGGVPRNYTIISQQPDQIRKHYTPTGAPVESKSCFVSVFFPFMFFPFIMAGSSLEEEALLDKVLEDSKADALIDAEFKHSSIFVPLLFMRSCLTVSGTPVKLKGAL